VPDRRRGRPCTFEAPAADRISLRLTSAQRLELRRVAFENQTNLSGVVREAVNSYVADYGDRRVFRRRP
jgi:hypothetical protein